MVRKFKLKILEGRMLSELEQKVEAFVQELEKSGGDSRRVYFIGYRTVVAFIESTERSKREPPNPLVGQYLSSAPLAEMDLKTLKEVVIARVVKDYLRELLEKHQGNILHTARATGVTRYYCRQLLKRHGLYRPKEGKEE